MRILKRKINVSIGVALLCFLATTTGAQDKVGATSVYSVLKEGRILSLTHWNVKNARLTCVVSSHAPGDVQRFEVYREENGQTIQVFSTEGDLIISMIPLSSYDGRLLVTWSGGSTYYFRIFAYEGGKVKQVLDESSKLFPEVVYDEQGRESILVTKPRNQDGKWTSSHATTTVFKWNGGSYERRGRIPWERRLLCVSSDSCAGK